MCEMNSTGVRGVEEPGTQGLSVTTADLEDISLSFSLSLSLHLIRGEGDGDEGAEERERLNPTSLPWSASHTPPRTREVPHLRGRSGPQ